LWQFWFWWNSFLRKFWRFSIRLWIQHVVIRCLLAGLRGLVRFKQVGGSVFFKFFRLLGAVAQRFIFLFGTPVYRLILTSKRSFDHLYLPAKHALLYAVSNRFIFHIVAVGIVAVTSVLNVQAASDGMERFGEKSLLFQFVGSEDWETLEEVIARPAALRLPVRLASSVLSEDDFQDMDFIQEKDVAGAFGMDPLLSDSDAVAPLSAPTRSTTEMYVIQEGDTLLAVAERFGLNLSTVLWANQLTAKSVIRPGQSLSIPPIDGILYTVKKGDTISGIAKKYQSKSEEIIQFNRLASADDLHIGEQLILPGGEPPPVAVQRTASVAKIFTNGSPSPSAGGSSLSSAKAAAGGWVWPTDWHVITQYYGWRHTGLDIDGGTTQKNYASRAGIVTRAGWFGGYGLCVDVDHGDGFVTRYGHFAKIYVQNGQRVEAGEALGILGTTGRSTGTHLHFEIIENGKRRNPLDFIR